jgi:hypothetical protein
MAEKQGGLLDTLAQYGREAVIFVGLFIASVTGIASGAESTAIYILFVIAWVAWLASMLWIDKRTLARKKEELRFEIEARAAALAAIDPTLASDADAIKNLAKDRAEAKVTP